MIVTTCHQKNIVIPACVGMTNVSVAWAYVNCAIELFYFILFILLYYFIEYVVVIWLHW